MRKATICLFFITMLIALTCVAHASLNNYATFTTTVLKINEREVDFKITYKISVNSHINNLKIKMIVPADLKDRQKINKLNFSIKPDSLYQLNNNAYALYTFTNLDKDFKIIVKGQMVIYNIISLQADSASNDLSKYLIAEKNIEATNEKIVQVAKTLKQSTDIETVMKTFEYVTNHIKYKLNAAVGAEKVLETGVGKCMDYSDLFVALLRANNIPAKSIFGMVVDEPGKNPLHAWAEVYLKKQGWVRFDPTTGNSEIVPNGKDYKMRIANTYITLSEGRNDPELRTSMLRYYLNTADKEKMNIDIAFDIAGQ